MPNFEPDSLRLLLQKDKKTTSEDEVDFIFIKDIGSVKRESVKIDAIVEEAQRQGWCM